ncbi:MAG: PEP/pyruvate-binding domain-containing protein [Desulfobulbaceae bacterium]
MKPGQWLLHPLASWNRWRNDRLQQGLQVLKYRYQIFRALLEDNYRGMTLLTEIGAKLRTGEAASPLLADLVNGLTRVVAEMIEKQEQLAPASVNGLNRRFQIIAAEISTALATLPGPESSPFCLPLSTVEAGMLQSVGGKAATLATLKRSTSLAVPDGFVLTAAAGRFFLEHNGLLLSIIAQFRPFLTQKQIPGKAELAQVRRQILAAPLPPDLVEAIRKVAAPWFGNPGRGRLAVRSSAVSEDSRLHSFAGQFETVLNVSGLDGLAQAVKQVIASAFSGRNISYRLHAGLDPLAYDLAILCLEMVAAESSGTLFTRDPNDPDSGRMLISAVFGLGELAVSGSGSADIYRPHRFGEGQITTSIASKEQRLVMQADGGTVVEQLPASMHTRSVLSFQQLSELVQAGLVIERKFGFPQDIEWSYDEQGRLVILQSRPFRMATRPAGGQGGQGRQILLEGGMAASRGEGIGRAHLVLRRDDLHDLPEGPLVLILHQSLPDAVEVLDRVAALVVDLGNPVDHLSCVAREYGIPMLTGIEHATLRIAKESWIVVNANEGRIYLAGESEAAQARQQPRLRPRLDRQEHIPQTPGVRELYGAIIPLHLTDAYGPTFVIQECRSLHDIIRYLHEKAVLAMFAGGDDLIDHAGSAVRHLQSEVPFLVSLIDLGGGLSEEAGRGRFITAEQVRSVPFTALWRGVMTPGLHWGPTGGTVAAGGVMSRWLTDHRSARPIGMPNYALVTRDYLNLNARMDFHFIMVDTLCGIDPRGNSIRFRFKGGGTSLAQRRRRIRCIAEILEANGFLCNVQDDLLTATIQGGTASVIEEKLVCVGRLLGFTRLLDAAMVDDHAAKATARAFLAGNYRLEGVERLSASAQA